MAELITIEALMALVLPIIAVAGFLHSRRQMMR